MLTLRATLLKNTSSKGIAKLAKLKTGHSMLKGHKSKLDTETSSECCTCKVKENPEHFLLKCKEYDTEQTKLEKDIKEISYKNNCHKLNITLQDDLLGECDLPSQDTIIGEKWKSLFRQQEKKFKKRKEKRKK